MESQNELRNRFRSALAERTRSIVRLTEAASDPLDDATRENLLRVLHTLKGESRMLGLKRLAALCHALEEQLLSEALDFEAFRAIVDAISLAMAEGTSNQDSAELLRSACHALGLESPDMPETPSPSNKQADADEQTRWVQVDAAVVRRLGELLATLSVDFSKHRVEFTSGAVRSQDAAARVEELGTRLKDALSMALDLRLTSIETLLSDMGVHTRRMCQERGKMAEIEVRAHGVRVERDVLDVLREPILHLCSNAVVHGLEGPGERGDKDATGHITLAASSSSSGVIVTVSDDGRGVDLGETGQEVSSETNPEAFDLLFQHGYSTRTEADEIAGRGVGLDVVKKKIEAMGGSVQVRSEAGSGTQFSLFVPALLMQQNVVAFEVGSTLYGVSAQDVVAISEIEDLDAPSMKFNDETIPVRSFSSLLGSPAERNERHVLLLRLGGRLWALKTAGLRGHFEVIRRAVTRALRDRTGVGASAQLEDGRLLLILSTAYLERQLHSPSRQTPRAEAPLSLSPRYTKRVLVVDDSVVVRDLIGEILSSSGYDVQKAENGKQAMNVLETFQPGLVVTDVEMPEMDGFDLLAAVREVSSTLPVILVTARSSTADRNRASSLGASAYIAKGEFQRDTLVATIDRYYPEVT